MIFVRQVIKVIPISILNVIYYIITLTLLSLSTTIEGLGLKVHSWVLIIKFLQIIILLRCHMLAAYENIDLLVITHTHTRIMTANSDF